MKIGIFGGTFDPVHFGHLRSALEIKEKFHLEQVIFVPVFHPPHKDTSSIADFTHRFNMLEMVIKCNPGFFVSGIESERKGISYSIETIHYFREIDPSRGRDLYFIMGVDAFKEITTWKEYERIFSLCNLVIFPRPDFPAQGLNDLIPPAIRDAFNQENEQLFLHRSGMFVHLSNVTGVDISSSMLRRLARMKKSLLYLVPREVENYIVDNLLYRDEK